MAESICKKNLDSVPADSAGDKKEDFGVIECAVCLQNSIHPSKLPCGHIFCYLCVKGIVNQGRRCAICRQYIPVDYLDNPKLLKPDEVKKTSKGFDDGHLWFYEGRNGWWQYDERSSQELEISYQKGERCCELLIAGYLYIADFDSMLQYRRNDPSRKRRIKRDLATISALGVAGLKTAKTNDSPPTNITATESNLLVEDLQNLQISNSPITNSQQSSDVLPSTEANPTSQYYMYYLDTCNEFCNFSGWNEESSDEVYEDEDIFDEPIYYE